jgi:hypothetical protein
MTRKRTVYLILVAVILCTLVAVYAGFYWLVRVYLPTQINANETARKYSQWYESDLFVPPVDKLISPGQIHAFIKVNENLAVLLKKLHAQMEGNRWSMAIEIVKMQPEWNARKYIALQKYHLSPREYEWIENEVVRFWFSRWRESSLAKLQDYGWEMQMLSDSSWTKSVNYDILLKHEQELNSLFDILWPEPKVSATTGPDSF